MGNWDSWVWAAEQEHADFLSTPITYRGGFMELVASVSQQGRQMKLVRVKFGTAGFPEKEKGKIQCL